MTRACFFGILLICFVACHSGTGNVGDTGKSPASPPEPVRTETGTSIRGFPGGKFYNNYLLFIPDEYNDTQKSYPLILFLHNAMFRGSDIAKLKATPFWQVVESEPDFAFVAISPLCPSGKDWTEDQANLIAILDEAEQSYRIDRSRVYLTGHSIGGAGVWQLAAAFPQRFSAIAPLAGAAMLSGDQAAKLKDMPIWAFHGGSDNVAPPALHKVTVEQVRLAGNKDLKFTILPGRGHMIQKEVYQDNELFKWFLEQ